MKKWNSPAIKELPISMTQQSNAMSSNYDEVRTDQNGNLWVSFVSGGSKYDGKTDGDIIVPDNK